MPVSKFYTLDLLLYATELLARRTRASHRLTGFSGAQAQLAMHLEHGAVHAQDLAQRLQISKQAVAQLVDAMVAEAIKADPAAFAQVEVGVWSDQVWLSGNIVTRHPLTRSPADIVVEVGLSLGFDETNWIDARKYNITGF